MCQCYVIFVKDILGLPQCISDVNISILSSINHGQIYSAIFIQFEFWKFDICFRIAFLFNQSIVSFAFHAKIWSRNFFLNVFAKLFEHYEFCKHISRMRAWCTTIGFNSLLFQLILLSWDEKLHNIVTPRSYLGKWD